MADQRKLTPADLFHIRLVGDVDIDPGGSRVVYVLTTVDAAENRYRSTLWLAGPGRAPAPLGAGDTAGHPRFSPDGRRIAYLSRDSGQPQVWVLPLTAEGDADTGAPAGGAAKPWQLTTIAGGVTEFAWSPDGAQLALIANLDPGGIRPETAAAGGGTDADPGRRHTSGVKVITELGHKIDGVGYLGHRRPQVCVVDATPGARPRQLTAPPYVHQGVAWSPDGTRILCSGQRGPRYDRVFRYTPLYAVPVTGGDVTQLVPDGIWARSPVFIDGGSRIAFLANREERGLTDNTAWYAVPAQGGEPVPLVPGFDGSCENWAATDLPGQKALNLTPCRAVNGRHLYSLASLTGAVHLCRLDLATGTVTPVTRGDRLVYAAAVSPDGRAAAVAAADPGHPGDIYWLDLATGAEERLTAVNGDWLGDVAVPRPLPLDVHSDDGHPVGAWVLPPAEVHPGGRHPAVLVIHGGPMFMYTPAFQLELQVLAARGYGVIFANPRGSRGYGEAHCAAIYHRWGDRDYADLMATVDQALATHPWLDSDRLAVMGGSYGGYMTNWIIGHSSRFKAAVTSRCVSDWRAMSGTSDGGWLEYRRAGGVPPWRDDTWYREQSPITYVEQMATPLLIEHQEGDLRCPIEQAELLFTALKYLDRAPVQFVRYPGEFHGMVRDGKPWHRVHRLQSVLEWFNTHLD